MVTKTFIEDTVTGALIDVATEEGHKILLDMLERARSYSYEAVMGDYSMGSINRAAEGVAEAKKNLLLAGYEIPEW